jgi:hypothetical protein
VRVDDVIRLLFFDQLEQTAYLHPVKKASQGVERLHDRLEIKQLVSQSPDGRKMLYQYIINGRIGLFEKGCAMIQDIDHLDLDILSRLILKLLKDRFGHLFVTVSG